jgi:hypothetical protein
VLGNRGPARRVGCPKDQFDIVQCSTALGCLNRLLLIVYITKEFLKFFQTISLA